jgi:hypothetical protein
VDGVGNLNAKVVQVVLESGTIGEMPFPLWLEHVGGNIRGDDFPRMSAMLAELGVEALRWEPGEERPGGQPLSQAYLVITFPSLSSLDLVHTVAVEICRSHFYYRRGKELWVEYLIARPEIRALIKAKLEEGKIGDMPFQKWLEYDYCQLSLQGMANHLAVEGVVSVRWEESEIERRWLGSVRWHSYLVVTLPASASVSPPTLPSFALVDRIATTLRSRSSLLVQVTESAVELRALYHLDLPLDNRAKNLLGIAATEPATPRRNTKKVISLVQMLLKRLRKDRL